MKNKKLLFFICFLLVFPIDFIQSDISTIALPISLLLIIPSFQYFLFKKDRNKNSLILSMLFSLLGIVVIQFFNNSFTFKPYFSFIYLFTPMFVYFLSTNIIKDDKSFLLCLKYLSINIIIFSLCFFSSIFLKYNGIIREEGTLNGDFFGLKITGVFGVHTLGTQFFIFVYILIHNLFRNKLRWVFKILSIVTIIILIYIIIMSLSRELVLALLIFFPFLLVKKYGYIKSFGIILAFCFFIYFGFSNLIHGILSAWETKIAFSNDAKDLNELSSGRLDLQYLAFNQLINNPIFGTGFQGYTLNYASYVGYENLDGWSTHIYFLTVLWKMGIIAFVSYIAFLYTIIKTTYYSNKMEKSEKYLFLVFIVSFVIINLFWDALLAPNIMILFIFLLGMFNYKNKILLKK